MRKIVIILNHTPTEEQINDLKLNFNVTEIIYPPEELKNYLLNIPPEDEKISENFLKSIIQFIKENLQNGDFIWVQTEYGATFYIVDYAIKNGYIPIYSTTKRVYEEKLLDKNKIERKFLFKHVRFRRYIGWSLKKN